MPLIRITYPRGALSPAQKRQLAASLTEIVLEVEVDAGVTAVWVDGAEEISAAISGWTGADVLVGFTAGTGRQNNEHAIDAAFVGCP